MRDAKTGKVGFEFEARTPRPAAGKPTAKAVAAEAPATGEVPPVRRLPRASRPKARSKKRRPPGIARQSGEGQTSDCQTGEKGRLTGAAAVAGCRDILDFWFLSPGQAVMRLTGRSGSARTLPSTRQSVNALRRCRRRAAST